jgi:energy-coupling factor transporter ATP-binding protein EcfA2
MQIKMSEAFDCVSRTIRKQLVPMLVGSPGAGKSALIHSVAKHYNLKLIDVRLSQCDPTDLMGFPQINEKTGKAGYVPMETFPIAGDEIPNGYSGWLIFFDELNSASPAVQAAAYKILLDKMVGVHHLHKNVAMAGAGNLETDNAIVQPLSTALQSRMIHFELAIDSDEWVDWATDNDIDHRITSFIKFKPSALFTFHPDHTDKTYGCPRTWEFANRFVKEEEVLGKEMTPILSGTLSEGLAREFIGFCKIYQDLPTMASIIANPTGIKIPEEPSVMFALTGAISNHAKEDTISKLMEFVERLPAEFQVITLREIVRRTNALIQSPAVNNWVNKNATELF